MVGEKNVFFSYFISGIPNFSYMGFLRKCLMFRRSIPLRHFDKVFVKNTRKRGPTGKHFGFYSPR